MTDDGLPQGATVTQQWTQQSGPGTATFANATSASTGVTFSVAGTYVLRLTADDTALTAFDEVTITVNPVVATNLAPLVSAGPNQSITLPGGATLFGSVTDDGLPQGAAVSVAWTLQSGPGIATVANPTSPSTTATFSVAGTYVLRLTADDTVLTAFAETTITVKAPVAVNQPPTVNAGASQTVTLPAAATLDGAVSDDGLPQGATVTQQWTQQSGPGTATFADATRAGTTATFTAPGVYVLRLTASDTVLTAYAEATITVNPVPPVNLAPVVVAGSDITLTLPASAALNGTVSDDGLPQGAALTIQWTQLSGPGTTTFANAASGTTAATFSTAGDYVLQLAASDTDKTTTASLTVHALAPAITNRAPVVDAGPDVQVAFGGSAHLQGSVTDDGQPTVQVTSTWQKLSGPGAVSFVSASSPVTDATFAAPGVYVLTLSASDSALTATDDMVVTVAPPTGPADRAPPIVSIVVPNSALPGATIEARVTASDDTAVSDVSISVDGDTPVTLTSAPYVRTFTVPSVVSPGQTIQVQAVARDAAQNHAEATGVVAIGTVPDTDSPTVQVFGPASTTPGASITFSAQATDAVGVDTVSFLVDGVVVFTAKTSPYTATYTVPVSAPVGTPLVVTARATDFAGNAADGTIQVDVVAQASPVPPVVTLTVPPDALPGEVLTLEAQVTDPGGVASVTFLQGTASLQSLVAPPYRATFTVPIGAPAGDTFAITAEATNFASLTASDSKTVTVRAASQPVLGVVTGEVYDDTTSLPLPDAIVELLGTDASGAAYVDTTLSDARGRFVLRGNAGTAVVRLRKDAWTSADRPVTLVGGQAIEVLDARLTPLLLEQPVSAAAGGTLALATGSVTFAPGALPQSGPIRFATLSQQGLQGRPPLGWSPVAAAEIWPHALVLGSPASLRIRSLVAVPAAQSIVAALWDDGAQGWRAVGTAQVSADGTSIEGTTGATGQVAFFVADVVPQAPPAPSAGALLQPVAAGGLPGGRTTTILPQPQVLFYQPGVRSDVHADVETTSPATSGTLLTARIVEAYAFTSGADAHPQPFVEDLLFFQSPAVNTTLASDLTVVPSLTFESTTLSRGSITVELFEGQPGVPIPVVDVTGGTVQGPAGEQLVLPPAALSTPSPVTLRSLDAASFAQPLPAGLTAIGGLEVTLGATLARAAAVSIDAPATLVDDTGVVLVRLAQVAGRTRMVLVGVGRISGNRLVSETSIGGQQTVLEGVRGDGQYMFLLSATPLGFAGGTVLGPGGAPFAGALITTSTFPVVSLTTAAGVYVAAAPAGTTQVTAADLQKNDTATAPAYLAVSTIAAVPLQLTAQPPAVAHITPAQGDTNVPLAGVVVVTFSEPIDPATVTPASISLSGPAGTVDGIHALTQNNTVVTFRPVAPLAPNERYTASVTTAIADVTGYPLASAVSVTFDSLDTRPPQPPPAGAISASIPDPLGLSSVSGTQGTAGPTDRVFVDNLTTGAVAVALVQANGSFSTSIAAAASDALRVRIVDVAGNETAIDLGAFQQTNPDGSVSQFVSAAGGTVKGPNGIEAEVPAGAFDGGAVVTIKDVPLANFPVTLTAAESANFPLVQAVELDFGGAEAKTPIRLSVQAQPGDTVDDQWVVMQAVDVDGRKYLNVVDTAHFDNGRIVDPPLYCPGVMAAAVYGIAKAAQTFGLNYAQMQSEGRYQLQARTETFRAGLPFAIPFTTFNTILPTPVCFPVITGRITVSPNAMNYHISSDELYLADEQVIVRNATRGTQKIVTRTIDPTPFAFQVTGSVFDNYRVEEHGSGTPTPVPFTIAAGPTAQTVIVTPKLDRIAKSVHDFVVVNVTRNITKSFNVPLFTFTVTAPGSLGDTVELTAVPSAISKGVPHVITKGVSKQPSTPGIGNLVVRAQPGTIDPTRAEATAAGQTGGAARTVCPQGQTEPDPNAPCGVTLTSASGRVAMIIPDVSITQGGFAVAFEGDDTDVYTLTINYDTRPPFSVELPRFTLNIISQLTGAIVRTILGQAPPKDEPLSLSDLIGRITDDLSAPYLLNGPSIVSDLASGGFISFTFSEAMDADSLKQNVVVTDSLGNEVEGEIRVSNDNRTVTFVPSVTDPTSGLAEGGLQLGQSYLLTIKGALQTVGQAIAGACQSVCDAAGNAFQGVVSLPITTFGPRLLQHFPSSEPFKDVQMLKRTVTDAQGNEKDQTTLFVTAGIQHLVTFDVTDVSKPPVRLAVATADAPGIQRAALLPDVNFKLSTFGTPARDLLVTTAFNAATQGGNASYLNFFDVSDPVNPVPLGREALTADPDPMGGTNIPGAAPGTGFAKGVAAVVDPGGTPLAFAAVERMGVFGLDVGSRLAPIFGGAGRGHLKANGKTSIGGDFTDIVRYGCSGDPTRPNDCDKLVAIKKTRDGQDIVILGRDMSVLGTAPLTANARRLRVAEGLPFDSNGDGTVIPAERVDLAFVGGDNGITIVLLGRANSQVGSTTETLPKIYGRVPMSGTVMELEVSPDQQQLVVVFTSTYSGTSGPFIALIDVSKPTTSTLVDRNGDAVDDRIVYRDAFPSGVNGIRFDPDRELLYMATPSGLDIYKVGNLCCDLKVDMQQKRSTALPPTGGTAGLLAREKKALKTGIVKGLARAAAMCPGFDPAQMKIWESGSSACLWTATPDQACGSNYQPGVSDHDLSTFMPDSWYLEIVPNPDKTNDPKDKRAAQVPLASCVVQSLTYPFVNPNISDPELSPREPTDPDGVGFRFADISFLPNYTADLTSMRYRLARTMPGIPGDSDNTLGLGMQGLILKHLTEAYGVELSGVQDTSLGYQPTFDQVGVPESEIQGYLLKYRTDPTVKIPTIEGFEWANLMEYQLRKAYTAVRIRGAENPNSQFHDLFISQLHLAGKAGIRAALGRLSAVPATRDLILNFRRDSTDNNPGPLPGQTPLTLRGSGANACFQYNPVEPDPTLWGTTQCTGMEHYVASVAIRALALQSTLPQSERMFTVEDVRQVFDFYLVKADERGIETDDEADDFIGGTFQFVLATKALTEPEYLRWINPAAKTSTHPIDATPDPDQLNSGANDPEGVTTTRGERRANNMARKGVRMTAKAVTHLHVVPHIVNRGQRTVRDIKVGMYNKTPGGQQAQYTWTQVDTGAVLGFENLPKVEGGQHFYLEWQTDSDGSLSKDPGSDPDDEGVGKTLDLFELEVDQENAPKGTPGYVVFTVDLPERKVKEANRRNNYDGFHYYVIDPAACTPNTALGYGVTCQPPAGVTSKVPFPLPNSTLLMADTECDLLPELTLTQTIEVDGVDVGDGPVSMETGQKAVVKITVTNEGDVSVNDVVVRTPFGNYQSNPASIAAHASQTFYTTGYASTTPAVYLSLPSITASNFGFQIGPPATVLVNTCGTGPYIVGLPTDPNPIGSQSRVMRNGLAVRYFRAVDKNGNPAPGTTLTVRVPGIIGLFNFTADASGEFVYQTQRFNAKGEQVTDTARGIGIPFTNYVGADGSEAQVLIASINGQAVQCRNTELFRVFVDPLQFTYEFEAGGAIEAGLGVFGLGNANASLGGSFKLRLFHRGRDTKITEPGIYRLDWERKTAFGFTAKFGFDGFSAEGEFDNSREADGRLKLKGGSKAEAFKLGGNVAAQATQAYRYTFSGPMSQWSQMEKDGFTAILFPSVAESDEKAILQWINDPTQTGINLNSENMKLHRKAFGDLFEPVLGSIDAYKIFRSARIATFSATGDVQGTPFKGTVDLDIVRAPNPGDPPNAPVTKDTTGAPAGREATAADKADKKEDEKSEPAFSADSSFSGKFHVTYEVQEQLKHELGDPIRVNPEAVNELVVGAVHTLTFDTAYNYTADFKTNLGFVKAEIDKPNVNYPQEPQFVKDNAKKALDWLEQRIAGSDAAAFDGGLQFRVFSKIDAAKVYKPWRLEVTFRGPKSFGLVGGQDVGAGGRYSLTFAVQGEARTNAVIAEAFQQAAAFRVLLTQTQEADMKAFIDQLSGGQIPAEVQNVSPKELYLWFLKFVKSVLIYGGRPGVGVNGNFLEDDPSLPEFYEEVRKGTSEKSDFGLKQNFVGKKIGVSLQDFTLDSSVNYRTSHGIVVRGQLVVLEDYGGLSMDASTPRQLIEQAVQSRLQSAVDAVETTLFGGTVTDSSGNGSVSNRLSTLVFGSPTDQPSTGLGSFDWLPAPNLPPVTPYAPDDNKAPGQKPHYGIGGFRIVTSTRGQQLDFDAPATLTLSWDDTEVDGFAESTIRMFAWNATTEDWSLVPATIDTATNSATATILRGGLYTLGGIMPAGRLTWNVISVNRLGSGASATTAVSIESNESLLNNDGTPVAPGTVMHVRLADPSAGTVTTPDTDVSLAETQVPVSPDGKVRLLFSLHGSPSVLPIEVFSHLGTVSGSDDIPLP
ncbi:MAG: Ig-like domain-containing protein [Vicinamibacterales bacterium]